MTSKDLKTTKEESDEKIIEIENIKPKDDEFNSQGFQNQNSEDHNVYFSVLGEDIIDEKNNEEASKLDKFLEKKRYPEENINSNEGLKNGEPKYTSESLLKATLVLFFTCIISQLNDKIMLCDTIYDKKNKFHKTKPELYQGKPTISNGKKMLKKKIKEILNYKDKYLLDKIYSTKDFPSTKEETELYNYLEMTVKEAFIKIYNDESNELKSFRIKYDDWNKIFKNEKKNFKGFDLLYNEGLIKYYEKSQNLFKTLVDEGKNLLKECKLKEYQDFKEIVKIILFCPSGKYPKNRNVRNNIHLLKKNVRELLTEGKDTNLMKNKRLIDKIYKIEDLSKNDEVKKLKEFLEMPILEAIKLFYNENDEIFL